MAYKESGRCSSIVNWLFFLQTMHMMRPVSPTVGGCLETESPRLLKGIPDSPRGTEDRWPEAHGTVAVREEKLTLNPFQSPSLLCGFHQSRQFQKHSSRTFLGMKTLTNSPSSHLLFYSLLPRCYCEKLAVKFNWFQFLWIHMAANPGAEAAAVPRHCFQAFASPPVPRWWE